MKSPSPAANRSLLFYLIIFAEGYVVLSYELMAIRIATPFVGSGSDTVSIIIAAVLMPLAFGYHAGGSFRPGRIAGGQKRIGYRDRIIRNFVVSALFIVPGTSIFVASVFFNMMTDAGLSNRLLQTTLYSVVFIVYPVFLLAQTIPLISNYFSKGQIARTTGLVLLFSTLGSFMGAVFSTLVLMSWIGVHNTAIVTVGVLALLTAALARRLSNDTVVTMVTALGVTVALNSPAMMRGMNIVENNRFNLIRVIEHGEHGRIFSLNNGLSSKYNPKTGEKWDYIEFVEDRFIDNIPDDGRKRDILVIGAGGFTLGLEDEHNNYVFIDIDGSLKEVAEDHFLPEELGPNKSFEAQPARGYLRQTDRKFDLILIDVFHGSKSIPEALVTAEFFQTVKDHLAPGGAVVANFIVSVPFNDAFSRNLFATFESVFWPVTRQVIGEFDPWTASTAFETNQNVMHIYFDTPGPEEARIYTDLINRSHFDKPHH